MAFVQRGSPQTLLLQSLVRGEPYPSRWRPRHSGDVEALNDLALLDGPQMDFDDPGGMGLEYPESELGPEDNGGDLLDWPAALEGRDGFNLSESEGRLVGLGFATEGAESSLPSPSTGATINQGAPPSDPTSGTRKHVSDETMGRNHNATRNYGMERVSGRMRTTCLPGHRGNDTGLHRSNTVIRFSSQLVDKLAMKKHLHICVCVCYYSDILLTQLLCSHIHSVRLTFTYPLRIGHTVIHIDSLTNVGLSAIPRRGIWRDSELQNTSLASSGPTFTPKPQNDSVHSSQPSQIRTSHPTKAPSHLKGTQQSHMADSPNGWNISYLTAARRNQTPKAVTLPVTQVVSLSTIINGSQSTGDGVIISHHWEQVGDPSIELGAFSDTQILNLSNLAPGEYTFRLTITDSDGLSDSTMATVKVIQSVENDQMPYPSHVTLTSSPGLAATLAHRQDDPTAATPSARASVTQKTALDCPQAANFRHSFTLVHLVVNPRTCFNKLPVLLCPIENKSTPIAEVKVSNRAPVAIVGPNRQLTLPVTSVTLDGSSSTDDHAVTSYHWDTIRGPPGSRTQGVDKPIAIVASLRAGRYTFSLTVSDQEGLKDSALLTVRVQEARSLPPVAHASGSHTLTLPNNSLVLRGSVTDGDPATVHFLWVRDSQSPAAGDVLYGSEQQASLYLANLVEGTYLFQLRVTDTQGRSSTATATMEVRPDPGGREEVEVEMLVALAQVSVSQKDTVLRQLAALLHVLDNGIHLRGLWGHSDISVTTRKQNW
ncbi:unnamed protein product [Oncorhynchus mykiss]|uniref:PKD/Chitinase domain-containing protein n=1 Tax=Oncorhynchus mykiss TaxID=8022 RepID=A0A060X9V7_ONCMY|nr:unnamed protein product [Oncorhynchus mykiss]